MIAPLAIEWEGVFVPSVHVLEIVVRGSLT